MPAMQQTIPTQHIAGDAFSATLADARHLASAGWALSAVLIGQTSRHNLAAASTATGWAVTAAPTETTAWPPGAYTLHAVYSKTPGQRVSYVLSALRVLPDPLAPATLAANMLGPAQRAYQDLQAAYRAYLAAGKWTVQEYQIAGRRMTFRTAAELMSTMDGARREAEAEQAADGISAGVNPRRRFVVRM